MLLDGIEEQALVTAMLAGDELAMTTFSDRYLPPLYRFALSRLRGNREQAMEVVQATVCKALDKLASYRGEAALLTWLCACCRNEIHQMVRRKGRGQWVDLDDEAPPPALTQPPPQLDSMRRRQEAAQVHAALDHLPERYARALEWKYLERLPVKAIAERLGLRPKAAESLLTRAREAFRRSHDQLVAAETSAS